MNRFFYNVGLFMATGVLAALVLAALTPSDIRQRVLARLTGAVACIDAARDCRPFIPAKPPAGGLKASDSRGSGANSTKDVLVTAREQVASLTLEEAKSKHAVEALRAELAEHFRRTGRKVPSVHTLESLSGEDPDAAEILRYMLVAEARLKDVSGALVDARHLLVGTLAVDSGPIPVQGETVASREMIATENEQQIASLLADAARRLTVTPIPVNPNALLKAEVERLVAERDKLRAKVSEQTDRAEGLATLPRARTNGSFANDRERAPDKGWATMIAQGRAPEGINAAPAATFGPQSHRERPQADTDLRAQSTTPAAGEATASSLRDSNATHVEAVTIRADTQRRDFVLTPLPKKREDPLEMYHWRNQAHRLLAEYQEGVNRMSQEAYRKVWDEIEQAYTDCYNGRRRR